MHPAQLRGLSPTDSRCLRGWTVVNGEDGESEATGFTDNLLVKTELNRADGEILSTFVDLVPWNRLAALQR